MTNSEFEPNRFKKFLNMAFIFKKQTKIYSNNTSIYSLPKNNTELDTEVRTLEEARLKRTEEQAEAKEKLDTLFDTLVRNGNEVKIVMILERGYQINIDQALELMKKDFNTPIIKEFLLKTYNNSLKDEISSNIKEFIKNYNDDMVNFFDEYSDINYELSQFSKRVVIIWEYINQINYLQDEEYALKFRNECHQLKEIFEENGFDYESYKIIDNKSNKKLITLLTSYIQHIEDIHKDAIYNEFSKELDGYYSVLNSFETIKENMVAGMLESVKKFEEKSLPIESQKLINQITEISNEITPHILTTEQNLEFNNIYKKRFPQVLEEYVNISPRYREKLKIHNENPDIILIESLQEIKEKIEDIFNTVQDNNYNRQKVTYQYLKNK